MKKVFISKISEINLDNFISNFMDYKDAIGNGVGAGKAFEKFFCDQINKVDGINALHLNLSNSNFIWDVIVSDNINLQNLKDELISIIKNNDDIENKISTLLGQNWLGISLKTYKDDACQITTDYSYRTFLDNNVSESDANQEQINEFFTLLNKHDQNRYLIIALNTYDNITLNKQEIEKLENKLRLLKNKKIISEVKEKIEKLRNSIIENTYTFRLLEFQKSFDKIVYKKNTKLSQYDLCIDGTPTFKVLYGKNQANPFQRGIWTHNSKSIEYFQMIKTGTYKSGNYSSIVEKTIGMSPEQINQVLKFIKNLK